MATRAYDRRPLPWPLRLLSWLLTVVLVLLILAATVAALIAVGASVYYEVTRTKAGDLEKMIETRLPAGAPAERITAVLDEEGIEHGMVEAFPGDDHRLLYDGVTKGTPIISAFVPNEGHSLELVDIEIIFVLDGNGALARHLIYEVRHQPEWLNGGVDALMR